MSYSCLEELKVDLDLHALDKTIVLSKAGYMYDDGWLVITDDGICHLFDKDGNPDDIKKVTQLEEKHIRKDIKKIAIPENVKRIGNYAFYDCRNLTSMTIPNSVISIGSSAFDGCDRLMSITIPDSVMSIKEWAFFYCTSLTSVTIPNSVISIWDYAFLKCDKLTNLTFKGKTLEQVKKMANYPWGIKDESIIKVG